MISSLSWIPFGAAKENPIRFELTEEEMAMVYKNAKREENGDTDRQNNDQSNMDVDNLTNDLPAALNMEHYDSEEEDDCDNEENDMKVELTKIGEHTYAVDNEDMLVDDDSEDNDAEDTQIKHTDNVLIAAVTNKEEQSELQVWVLTDENDDYSFYLHHDILLPDIPICIAWMDIPPFREILGDNVLQSSVGNYVAVGTFQPAIEIWNLDVLDVLEPTATLGGVIGDNNVNYCDEQDDEMNSDNDENIDGADNEQEGKKLKKKKKKHSKKSKQRSQVSYKPGSHEGAVMCLDWNKSYRQALASGSADSNVKIWDVTTQTCLKTFGHHRDKVQTVRWHSIKANILATGSYDRTICIVDCLQDSNNNSKSSNCVVATYDMKSTSSSTDTNNIESLAWNPDNEHELFASFESGHIVCIDRRITNKTLYSFQAHNKPVTSMSFSRSIPGMLCSASIDKTVKIWDVNVNQEHYENSSKSVAGIGSNNRTSKSTTLKSPKCVAYKTMGVGKALAVDCSYIPATADKAAMAKISDRYRFLIATGGDGNDGAPAVWFSDEIEEITNHFRANTCNTEKQI